MNIEINLSKDSVKKAIRELEAYRDSLKNKNEIFVEKLADLGVPIIDKRIGASTGDASTEHDTEITIYSSGDHAQAVLSVSGREIMFIEFGSGIYYNKDNPAPHAAEFGYGVGTWPGQKFALNEKPPGWWYRDDANNLHRSLGQQATAPLLSATHEIIENIRKIAREVYAS